MAEKVLVNLATGMEDGERVLVALLVATAAQQQGKEVVVWATKDAVRLGTPGVLQGVVCKGCPPLERLWEQFTEAGGELLALSNLPQRPRDLDEAETVEENVKVAGATPMLGVGRAATPLSSATETLVLRRSSSPKLLRGHSGTLAQPSVLRSYPAWRSRRIRRALARQAREQAIPIRE